MTLFYFLVSIAILTLLAWGLRQAKLLNVCPICAGVLLTWVGGLAALYLGAAWANPLLIAILMGASLGALAEKYGHRFGLFWKVATVLLGFAAIYFLLQKLWWQGALLILPIIVLTLFLQKSGSPAKSPEKKDLFKECC